MITTVDTNILLDILIPGATHAEESERLLDRAYRDGRVTIPEVVYAELAATFGTKADLDDFLAKTDLEILASTKDALFAAGEAWKTYARRRSRHGVECPACGQSQEVKCGRCSRVISWRQHMIGDFLVGGHALRQTDRLATRDLGFYKTHFPTVPILVA